MAHDSVINSVVQTRAFTVIDAFFNTVLRTSEKSCWEHGCFIMTVCEASLRVGSRQGPSFVAVDERKCEQHSVQSSCIYSELQSRSRDIFCKDEAVSEGVQSDYLLQQRVRLNSRARAEDGRWDHKAAVKQRCCERICVLH